MDRFYHGFNDILAMAFPVVTDPYGGNKISIDLEFTICVILFNTFVVAPYLMGLQYTEVMGPVIQNIWPVALASIAPAVGKPGIKLIDYWLKAKTPNPE